MKSYFIDTNYFLRFLIKEDLEQFAIVYELFRKAAKEEILLITSIIVFFEINWVLSSFYKKDKSACIPYLEKMLGMDFLALENRGIIERALALFKSTSLQLEDCYNLAFYISKNIKEFATFDKKIIAQL